MSKFFRLCLAAWLGGVLFGAHRATSCQEIRGEMELLEKANLHFLLIGEVHGTKETPAIFSELICPAAGNERKTVLLFDILTK